MVSIQARALHWVFKIPNRRQTGNFYRDILGMKILRHEEFTEGCEAACNGPYDNRWSKTMVGYGPEDDHFVIELTYNYTKNSYDLGNDFLGITIRSREALERAKQHNWPVKDGNVLVAPGGYKFHIIDEPQPTDRDPIEKVTLACSQLMKSIAYWNGLLHLNIYDQTDDSVTLAFDVKQTKLELKQIEDPIDRAEAYGRIAFSCPYKQQDEIESIIKCNNQTILTPMVTLDTPGKASVRVIILADPDGHEICFVDDEGFRQLSQVEPDGDKLFDRFVDKEERDCKKLAA